MGVTVKVEALARQHEDALDMVEVLEDVAQRWQALLFARAVDGWQATVEQGHKCAADGAIPRAAEQTPRGEEPRTRGGLSTLGDDVHVVNQQGSRHARPLGSDRRPEQQVVAGHRVYRLALERRACVAGVGRGGPHYHAVARAREGAERRACLRVADEVLGTARAVRRLDEWLEA